MAEAVGDGGNRPAKRSIGDSHYVKASKKMRPEKLSQALEYDALESPEEQIRLLKFRSNGGGGGGSSTVPYKQCTWRDLSFELSTWTIANAPAFYATSYTWGNFETKVISVNGKMVDVRQNCHYILWQVMRYRQSRREENTGYVWCDSICIDQKNNAEKSHQVRIMWRIYQRAFKVLACVGPEADGSQGVMGSALALANRSRRSAPIPCDQKDSFFYGRTDWEYHFFYELGQRGTAQLYRHFYAFSTRTYWTRLWVVQEIASTKPQENAPSKLRSAPQPSSWERGEILCGTSITSLEAVRQLCYLLEHSPHLPQKWLDAMEIGPSQIPKTPLAKHFRVEGELGLEALFVLYCHFGCSDARDRVYGLLHCARLPKPLARILPDYDLSPWELATHASSYLWFESIEPMLIALGIDSSHPQMHALFKARTMPKICSSLEVKASNKLRRHYDDIADGRTFPGMYGPLSAEMLRQLRDQSELDTIWSDIEGRNHPNGRQSFSSIHETLFAHPPKVVSFGTETIALVSGYADEGHWLFEYAQGTGHLVLVINFVDASQSHFTVVGQGIIVKTGALRDAWWETKRLSHVESSPNFSPEDKILLFGQDLVGADEIDSDLRILRLATNPLEGKVLRTTRPREEAPSMGFSPGDAW